MKDMLLLQARYNQFADNNLLELLEKQDYAKLEQCTGTYFKSVLGTMEHYVGANIMFFTKFFVNYADSYVCVNEILAFSEVGMPAIKAKYKKDFKSLQEVVITTNAKMLEIIQKINDFESMGKIELPSYSIIKPRGELILGILNHSIHHRGEISAMLETLGIPNDFARVLAM